MIGGKREEHLTQREFQLLHYLMRNRDEADGSVKGFAASLVGQAVNFGRPDARHQELDAITREFHLLRPQVKVLELQMQAEAELAPIET